MKFCGECGVALKARCARCGTENPPQFKFCGECGASLVASAQLSQAFSRAFALSQHLEETPQIFPVLFGLAMYYGNRGEYRTGMELAERCLRLANLAQDSGLRLVAESGLVAFLAQMGELVRARESCEQRLMQYDPIQHGFLGLRFGLDPGMVFGGYSSLTAWYLGYPDHALTRARETWTLAQGFAHPPSRALGAVMLPWVHFLRREPAFTQERIESVITFSTTTEQVMVLALGTMFQGAALVEQGHTEDRLALLQQGWSALQAIGTRIFSSVFLLMLAHAYELLGQTEKGLAIITEVEAFISETGERWYEAELYRLKGTLTLQSRVKSQKLKEEDAEACFLKAIAVAQEQHAKSWELRASTSLARLWQQQGKKTEARQMLAEIYNWFTEGFETKDLQEVQVLLKELG